MFEQMNIFDVMYPTISIDKPIRLLEFFAGIGAQAMALRNLGVQYENWKTCEWEVHANASYHQIHNPGDTTDYSAEKTDEELIEYLTNKGISTNGKNPMTEAQIRSHQNGVEWRKKVYNDIISCHNLVNISQTKGENLEIIDTDKFCYLLTYSFPCQDLSLAGKRRGMAKGSGTRSGLLWEVERLLNEVSELPQILLMENVPAIMGEGNREHFGEWQDFLRSKGYSNYAEIINAKDYGVAQNRERCFMVSILGEINYKFPTSVPLRRTMNDYLDDVVPEKYYINSPKAQELIVDLRERGQLDGISKTIRGGGGTAYSAILHTAERSVHGWKSVTTKLKKKIQSWLCSYRQGRTRSIFTIISTTAQKYALSEGG